MPEDDKVVNYAFAMIAVAVILVALKFMWGW